MCSRTMLAILFMVRLRRLVDGTLGLPGSDDDSDGRQEKRVKAGLVAGFLLR